MKEIQLTYAEVFDFKKYTGLLYSTVSLLSELNLVWQQLEFTAEESQSFSIENGIPVNLPNKYKSCTINPEGALISSLKYFNENVTTDEGVAGKAKQTFQVIISKVA